MTRAANLELGGTRAESSRALDRVHTESSSVRRDVEREVLA